MVKFREKKSKFNVMRSRNAVFSRSFEVFLLVSTTAFFLSLSFALSSTTKGCCTGQYLERQKYKNCNESQSDEVNGVGSIPVWSGGMDFEEIAQKQNRNV